MLIIPICCMEPLTSPFCYDMNGSLNCVLIYNIYSDGGTLLPFEVSACENQSQFNLGQGNCSSSPLSSQVQVISFPISVIWVLKVKLFHRKSC